MKMSMRAILVLGLVFSGFLYVPVANAAPSSVTFWERGVGADFTGTVCIINDLPTHVDDLLTCHTVVSETGKEFDFQSPLNVDSSKRYVWIYTTSENLSPPGASPINTQSGVVPAEVSGNVVGYYKTQYMVTFASSPDGAGSTNYSGDAWLDEGAVMISATPSSGLTFTSWSSTGSITLQNLGSSNTVALISGPGAITANFISDKTYSLTAVSNGHGTVTPSGVTVVSEGRGQTFTFSPDPYYGVSQILVDGVEVPIASFITLSNVNSDHVINVTFGLDYAQLAAVTIESTPSGDGFVSVDGVLVTTPQTFSWIPDSMHSISAVQTMSGGEGVKYIFSSWSNGGGQSQNYTVVNSTQTLTAAYNTQYYLTAKTNVGTVTPASGWYDAGARVSVETTAPSVIDGEGYLFGGWKGSIGGYTGSDNPSGEFIMNSPVTMETSWEHICELSVESPYGTPNGAGWYEWNQIVHAGVTPLITVVDTNHQIVFTGWGGDASGSGSISDNIVMDGPKKAVAIWTPQYRLVFSQSGLQAGVFGVGNEAILDVDGTKLTLNDLPYRTDWIDDGSSLSFEFADAMTTSLGLVYQLNDLGAVSPPLVVESPITVQGVYSYKTIVFQLLNTGLLFAVLLIIALVTLFFMRRNKKESKP